MRSALATCLDALGMVLYLVGFVLEAICRVVGFLLGYVCGAPAGLLWLVAGRVRGAGEDVEGGIHCKPGGVASPWPGREDV